MNVNKNANSNAKNSKDSPKDSGGLRWVLIGGGIAWAILLVIAIWHPGITTRVKFFSDSTLNLFIVLAVIAQVFIYRRMATQNERLIRASEDSANVAREAFHIGEAPYFGITGMAFTELDLNRYPGVDIGFMNGGRTPAWHFHAMLTLIVGNSPETGERFDMQTKATSPTNNFYPSGENKLLYYKQIGFAYTEEHRRIITDQKALLFVEVRLSYQDRRKVRHNRTFHFAWHDSLKQFIDYEELFL